MFFDSCALFCCFEQKVGPAQESTQSVKHFSTHPDPTVRQVFLADTVMNSSLGPHKGIKYAAWSPLGCDSSGRCLLACLTLDHRLTVHYSHRGLEWNMLVDLTEKYSERLVKRGYAQKDNEPPEADLKDFNELQRRCRMQTPLKMDWSSVYTLRQAQSDNTCMDTDMVILAVLMENGDLLLWKFTLPATADSDVAFYSLIESGVTLPTDLVWWEYESCDRRMSGLIVGSKMGPLRIVPVSLTGVKGYFTLRHHVMLWRECDGLAVHNMRCVAIDHPTLKSRCSLVVASRGCYVFWCLLVISPAGLNVHNSHVTGLHSLPIVSLAVSKRGTAVYTISADGRLKKLMPEFMEKTLIFQQEDLMEPDCVLGKSKIQGLSVSCNDAYIALASTSGASGGNHQVNFVTLKAPKEAAMELLRSPTESLYKAADLLDLVRWQVLRNKFIPARLLDELEEKIKESDSPYLWRFKLFLVRVLYQSFRMPLTEHSWKPSLEGGRLFEDQEDGKVDRDVDSSILVEHGPLSKQEANLEEQMAKVQTLIDSVESHIMRKNAMKVLGVVYLNTAIAENTSVPTCGLMDYLSGDTSDRDSEVKHFSAHFFALILFPPCLLYDLEKNCAWCLQLKCTWL